MMFYLYFIYTFIVKNFLNFNLCKYNSSCVYCVLHFLLNFVLYEYFKCIENAVTENPVVQRPIERQGVPNDCWPQVHLSTDTGEQSSIDVWLIYRLFQPLEISWYNNFWWYWVGTDPIHWSKIYSYTAVWTSCASHNKRTTL